MLAWLPFVIKQRQRQRERHMFLELTEAPEGRIVSCPIRRASEVDHLAGADQSHLVDATANKGE
jgi:hypothetical protein